MNIEAGRFYRTRDGRKAGPIRTPEPLEAHTDYNWIGQLDLIETTWTEDGHWADGTHAQDLVAEWTDESTSPVRTVTRKEIVVGEYGVLRVRPGFSRSSVCLAFVPTEGEFRVVDIDQLRAAISTLNEIADALSEPPHA